ncbi:MAG: cbb3-type cytochrome c oxidase subunit I [Ilumatobacteraceae bacterium]
MTTAVDSRVSGSGGSSAVPAPLAALGRWLTAADHVRVGASLVVGAFLWALVGGAIGAVLGFERLDAGSALVESDALTQLFSAHRFALVFGVLAPLMLGVSVLTVPAQLHASNISLPRLAAFGWWAWLAGSVVALISYLGNGGPGGGDERYVETYLLGLALIIVGLVTVSVSVATTVLTRRNGRRLADIPVGAFAALVSSIGVALTLPVALGTIAYLWVDFVNARVAFGGADLIDSWLGWLMREPQTLILAAPALGILADAAVRTAKSRQPLRGVVLVGVGVAATVVFSSVTQQVHVFEVGKTPFETMQSFVPFALFNLLPLLAPLIVTLLSLLALKAGTPAISAAFVASFLGVGMLFTGLVGSAAMHVDSLGLVGTTFGEAALVYVVYGAVLAAIGALALHLGSVTGRALPDTPVLLLSLVGFIATVLASLPHYVAGFLDQPVATAVGYDDSGFVGIANAIVGLGHALMVVVVLAFAGLVAKSRRGDAVADRYAQGAEA